MAAKLKIAIFYITLFLCILAYGSTAVNYDFDLWARLIAGMGFVQTGHVLKHDFLSYTPTHIWYDHEWGSGVVFYLTQHFFSGTGLLILQTILAFFAIFFMVQSVKLRVDKNTSPYNILFYFFTFVVTCYNLLDVIRCQLFSFMFFAIFLYILELSRHRKTKWLITLPFLMIVWNNLHGGCVSGLGLIALYSMGEVLNKKSFKNYIYTFIASFIALIINPWGVSYLNFLFAAAFMNRPYIVEWWGLFSKMFMFGYLQVKIYMLVLFGAEIIFIKNSIQSKTFDFDFTKLLVILFTLINSIMHVKLIPFMIIAMTVFLYEDFYSVFNLATKNFFSGKIALTKDIFVYSIIIFTSVVMIKANISKPMVNFDKYPIMEVEFIKINHIKGNVLANFGHGSYISYKLYPQNKIYMDGRYEEVYSEELVDYLRGFELAKPGWEKLLAKYPTDLIIIEKFYPIYNELSRSNDWTNLVEDKKFALFIKTKKLQKHYELPATKIIGYQNRIFDTDINFMLQSKNATNR